MKNLVETGTQFHAERKGNCAQSVAYALARAQNLNDAETETFLNEARAFGGGRSPEGVCGALYEAQKLCPTHAKNIELFFKNQTNGKIHCKAIRSENKISCNECVKIACQALEENQ